MTTRDKDDNTLIPPEVDVMNLRAGKPSSMFHGDLYTVRLYTDESIDGHVYPHVKHLWYKNRGKTLNICHYFDDGTWRFVSWHVRQVVWMQMEKEVFTEEHEHKATAK